ncbi:Skp family chaperone for outer membrane proteins [Variovorax boronicumulans]|uniref:Skp family chaperone for outer membrane proteins n=1 Tax=Variovorax boronicumulans TaxID=436515 RepID=A0AAW8DBI8_9BURK|nr:OmpH family outer membrane protein [Variovorax boronicumulans]MDP9897221.1 Skp family chaperone for outer membrane proteins [Variovorax boronicumulans]MDQ0057262.1 Skp family chaperone for outer membrane proteins [Variovorax boronicumulans]
MAYVDLEYVLWHSDLAEAAQARLAQQRRDAELALQAEETRSARSAPSTLAPAKASIARRRLQADMEQRQIDELRKLADAARQAVQEIAKAEGFDFVVHDAVFVQPLHDITQRVLMLMRQQAHR